MELGLHSILQPPSYEDILDKVYDSIKDGDQMTVEVAQGPKTESTTFHINSIESGIISGIIRDGSKANFSIEISSNQGDSSKPAVALILPL